MLFQNHLDQIVEGCSCRVDSQSGGGDAADGAIRVGGLEGVAVDDPCARAFQEDHPRLAEIFAQYFEGLHDAQCGGHGVGGRDGGDDVAGHLLNVEFRFRLDAKDDGAEVGAGGDEVEGIFVVFVEGEDWRWGGSVVCG